MDNYKVVEVKIIYLYSGVYSSCMVSYNSNKNGVHVCRAILIHYQILHNGILRKMER
jgi:hypothetical protein